MSYQVQAQTAILKLGIWFGVLFVLLPRWLFPRPQVAGAGERFFANLARMVVATAVIVQGLVLLHLFDFFSLVTSYLALGLGIASLRRGRLPIAELSRAIDRIEVATIEIFEGRFPYRAWVAGRWQRVQQRVLAWNPERETFPWSSVLAMILLMSAGLRLAGVPARAAPGDAGTYLHMAWTRLLTSNTIWLDGAYPMGAHSWVQAVAQFARVDEALLVRTVGGLAGLLLTVGVYVAVRYAGGRRGVAVLATAVYGVFIFSGVLPAEAWRQQELHPFELGLVFLLPALMFCADFLDTHRWSVLLLAGECLTAAFLFHPISGLFGLLGWLSILVVRALRRPCAVRRLGWAAAAGGAAALLGSLFLIAAHLLGRPRHQGVLDIARAFFTPGTPDPVWQATAVGLAALAAGLILSPRDSRATYRRSIGLLLGVLLALFVGYPALLAPDKVGIPLSLVAAAALGLELDVVITLGLTLLRRLAGRVGAPQVGPSVGLTAGLVALAIAGMTVISPPLRADPGRPQEPEALARVLYQIKREHLAYTWTVVGYAEALPQVLGRGYYLSWKDFLARYDPQEYRFDPRDPDLAIPTRYVFIMVEKQVFVGPNDMAVDTLERARLQVALQEWVERYQQRHDDMSVYYADNSVAVYQIYRSPEIERRIIEEYEMELLRRRRQR